MTAISIPASDRPTLSILMVVYGQARLAIDALRSVTKNTDVDYEVVVVDNASPDGAGDQVSREVEGIRYVPMDTNIGFGQGMNRAVREARGEFLCLLNSDTQVGTGWATALLEPVRTDPRVGAVVPRFVFPDGRLQEAGSALGSDGITWAIGGYETEGLPAFDVGFPRWTDFGSAACMVIRRADFDAVGGFDPVYGIGYFEDVELCMELARRGMRTRYEPACDVVHLLGASSDPGQAPRLSHANRQVFLDRWRDTLQDRPPLADVGRNVHRVVHARDWTTPTRVIVAGSLENPHAKAVVDAVHPETLDVRVTVVATRDDPVPLHARGVEVVPEPDASWFTSRSDVATTVLLRDPTVASEIARTQPFAGLIVDLGQPDAFADSTIGRARAVIARDAPSADRARRLAPDALVVDVNDPGDPDRVAADLLAHAGVYVPA
jgi:O-antigen biosynthesis protein